MNIFLKHHVIYMIIIAVLFSCIICENTRTRRIEETFKDIAWLHEHSAHYLQHSVEILKKNADFSFEYSERSEATFRRLIQFDLPLQASIQNFLSGRIYHNAETVLHRKSKLCTRPVLLNVGICDFYNEQDMEKNFRQTENLRQGFLLCFTVIMPQNSDISSDCLYLKIKGQKLISIPFSKWTYLLDISSYHPDYKVWIFMIPFQFENTEMREEYMRYLQRSGGSPIILPPSLLQSTDWIKAMQLQYNPKDEPADVQIFDFPLICFS